MTRLYAGSKRKAAQINQEGDSDEDCITVAVSTGSRNQRHVLAETSHNKRRRVLQYVLVPKAQNPSSARPGQANFNELHGAVDTSMRSILLRYRSNLWS